MNEPRPCAQNIMAYIQKVIGPDTFKEKPQRGEKPVFGQLMVTKQQNLQAKNVVWYGIL